MQNLIRGERRLYTFNNYYLSGIQHGIQSLHAAVEISVMAAHLEKTHSDPSWSEQYIEWAKNHKTAVLLNGGNSDSIRDIERLFTAAYADGLRLPHARFNEDSQSLDGALTCFAVILPETIFNARESQDSGEYWVSPAEMNEAGPRFHKATAIGEFITALKSCRLA